MKKVRLAIGTVGVMQAAVVGVATTPGPAAIAAPQRPHAPAWKNCTYYGNGRGAHASSPKGPIQGFMEYSGSCVWSQGLVLGRTQNGLTERVRFRSKGNGLLRSTFQAGYESAGKTFFSSIPDMYAYEVCEALVANSNHNRVIYGPVCEKI
jgi:hypothetical protein